MDQTSLIVITIIVFIIAFAAFRLFDVNKKKQRLQLERSARILPLYNKTESREGLTAEDVLPFAQNLLTRYDTFLYLKELMLLDLFPQEYFTLIKGAESSLAQWLEFPTELDACPDEIEHVKRVTIDFDGRGNFIHYEVFKYRVYAPHWANGNWILGVVGPFFDDSQPYDFPAATFSRVSSTVDTTSPEEEAMWVHKNIAMRKQ
ncbi:hypothetical protein LX99_04622 [Mucilaginibacter oryzae]|uniref:Uncharacterized protein n=1 Tax=Mucilaginibacter oryzae TaxID=468058 RepID=A0A316GX99_9SPHI|nr:hypothetical protein [Mucilaginibacter oryzae]PWK69969.1 hypothetical protein LX99_04622 [Mucilaginibacter oryzae]